METDTFSVGKERIQKAVQYDSAGRYQEAFLAYREGIGYFLPYLQTHGASDSPLVAVLRTKVTEYMARAELLKQRLDSLAREDPPIEQSSAALARIHITPSTGHEPLSTSSSCAAPPLASSTLSSSSSTSSSSTFASSSSSSSSSLSSFSSAEPALLSPSSSSGASVDAAVAAQESSEQAAARSPKPTVVREASILRITYGEKGITYESIFGAYLKDVREVTVADPYLAAHHQLQNLVRFAELLVRVGSVTSLTIITTPPEESKASMAKKAMAQLRASLAELNIRFRVRHHEHLHDREIQLDRRWLFRLGRGLDIYQPPSAAFAVGALDMSLRPCLETSISVYGIEP